MDKKNFIDIYKELSGTSSSIVNISEKAQKHIQDLASEYEKSTVGDYCFSTFFVVLFLATAPAIYSFYYDFIIGVLPHLENAFSQREYIQSNKYVKVSCASVLLAVISYTWIMPFLPNIEFFKSFKLVNRNFTFFAYIIFLNYIALSILLLFATSYAWLSDEVLNYLLVAWLLIPGLIVVFAPPILLILLVILIFFRKGKSDEKSVLLPSKITYELAELLNSLHSYNQQEVHHAVKDNLILRIDKIASLVKRMSHQRIARGKMGIYLESRFLTAAEAIGSLKLCVLFPSFESQKLLKRKIESILNVFLSGNYFNLPIAPYVHFSAEYEFVKPSAVKHFISMLTITGVILAPLLMWSIIIWRYEPAIPETVQPLLTMIYSMWCLIVIVSFSEKLVPEAKSMITDMFKLLINK